MKWLWCSCLIWLLILGGCGTSDLPNYPNDTADVPCNPGESRCNGTMIQHCGVVGFFRDYDDCAVVSQICGMRLGAAVCYLPGMTDTASDSGETADTGRDTATVGLSSDSDSWNDVSTATGDDSDTGLSTDSGSDSGRDTVDVGDSDSASDVDTAEDTEEPSDTGCGDGIRQVFEACDDGNRVSNDGCTADCLEVEAGWNCVPEDGPCHVVAVCGDGRLQSPELCDDEDNEEGDGCDKVCRVELGWRCSGEPSNCTRVRCGNGVIESGEACDDGNAVSFDGCDARCQLEPDCVDGVCEVQCGDGVIGGSEECDDGNQTPGDGCSADCIAEAGYACAEGDRWGDVHEIQVIYKDFEEGDNDFDQFMLTEDQELDGGCTRVSPGMVEETLNFRGKPELNASYGDPTVGTNPTECDDVESDASFAAWFHHDLADEAVVPSTMVLWRNENGDYVNRWQSDGTRWSRILDFEPEEPDYQAIWCGEGGDNESCDRHACAEGEKFDDDEMLCFYPCEPWLDKDYSCAVRFETLDEPEVFDGNPVYFPIDGRGIDNDRYDARISEAIFEGMHIYEESFIEANNVNIPDGYDLEHNFFFTAEMRFWFRYDSNADQRISSAADDDTWVFVNGRLAIDMGGIHVPVEETVHLQDEADDLALEDEGVYEVAIFHAERYRDVSAFRLMLAGMNTPQSQCTAVCGDGILSVGEQCDDGENDGGYNECAPGCRLDTYCGDGIVQTDYEDCDDGNLVNGDDCPNSCLLFETP